MTVFEIKCESSHELPLEKEMERFFETLVLKALSDKKWLYKETVSEILETKLGFKLSPDYVDNLLDQLWFEEMVRTKYQYGKWVFSLTKKGVIARNAKNDRAYLVFKQRIQQKWRNVIKRSRFRAKYPQS